MADQSNHSDDHLYDDFDEMDPLDPNARISSESLEDIELEFDEDPGYASAGEDFDTGTLVGFDGGTIQVNEPNPESPEGTMNFGTMAQNNDTSNPGNDLNLAIQLGKSQQDKQARLQRLFNRLTDDHTAEDLVWQPARAGTFRENLQQLLSVASNEEVKAFFGETYQDLAQLSARDFIMLASDLFKKIPEARNVFDKVSGPTEKTLKDKHGSVSHFFENFSEGVNDSYFLDTSEEPLADFFTVHEEEIHDDPLEDLCHECEEFLQSFDGGFKEGIASLLLDTENISKEDFPHLAQADPETIAQVLVMLQENFPSINNDINQLPSEKKLDSEIYHAWRELMPDADEILSETDDEYTYTAPYLNATGPSYEYAPLETATESDQALYDAEYAYDYALTTDPSVGDEPSLYSANVANTSSNMDSGQVKEALRKFLAADASGSTLERKVKRLFTNDYNNSFFEIFAPTLQKVSQLPNEKGLAMIADGLIDLMAEQPDDKLKNALSKVAENTHPAHGNGVMALWKEKADVAYASPENGDTEDEYEDDGSYEPVDSVRSALTQGRSVGWDHLDGAPQQPSAKAPSRWRKILSWGRQMLGYNKEEAVESDAYETMPSGTETLGQQSNHSSSSQESVYLESVTYNPDYGSSSASSNSGPYTVAKDYYSVPKGYTIPHEVGREFQTGLNEPGSRDTIAEENSPVFYSVTQYAQSASASEGSPPFLVEESVDLENLGDVDEHKVGYSSVSDAFEQLTSVIEQGSKETIRFAVREVNQALDELSPEQQVEAVSQNVQKAEKIMSSQTDAISIALKNAQEAGLPEPAWLKEAAKKSAAKDELAKLRARIEKLNQSNQAIQKPKA